ncbi:unnamed protein product [Cladocopium goreaui]|uniref:8-demethyl-8-(2-methoxy-alpha-L-rhamnosyl)-tetrac enomycin-C 3'-O-methyltransferase (O-methyltransferas e II) n=1 Tax=Cladocopium goreaui TaxID=2562237 RepID=A0A9P1GSQ3_9DINO|nr:unnamed protein product [Cladocopium goreaui]
MDEIFSDFQNRAFQTSIQHEERRRIRFVELDATEPSWPIQELSQDLVLMSYLCGSVPEELIEVLYRNALKVLKPGGRLVVHDFMVDDSKDGPALGAYWALQHVTVNPNGLGLTPRLVEERLTHSGFVEVEAFEMIARMTKVVLARKPCSPEEADDVLTLRGNVDLGFLYNSVRSFLLWRYLAENHVSDCRWFVKVDADTFLNLWALEERLRRYFNASEDQYLGSLKHTHLTDGGSGSTMHFAVNAIVLSGKLLSTARTWLNSCFDDIVWRRLGQGAEDVDLGLCLKVHGYVLPKKLGQVQEMPSRNFAAVITGSSGGDLLNTKGTCTILIHPLHAEEMYQVHAKLLQARAASEQPELCDWPEDEALSKTWSAYMAGTFNIENDRHQCWDLFFNWNLCCHERWGETGNSMCWDDENTWHRCCNRTDARNDPLPERRGSTDPAKAGRAARDIALATTTTSTSTSIARKERAIGSLGVEVFQVKNKKDTNASIVSLSSSQPKTQGNPKCWKEGFTFDLCCYSASTVDCWVWPFSRDFCCYAPLSPRAPIRSGGLRQQGPGKRPRTSRCQDLEDQSLLACQLSLDEMGVLFELPTIGSGDKASGWHDYLGVYERFLLHLPLTSDLLEFGVRMGSSLAMWSEYFPKGTVVGVDKNLATFFQTGQPVLTAHGAFTRGNVYVLEANASDVSGRQKLERLGFDRFDVVVDDANHWAKDQIARFELYFPELLRPGGAYIIEDVHMQAPWTRDGSMVREYFANLTAWGPQTQC